MLRVLVPVGVLAAVAAGVFAWRSQPEAQPLPEPPVAMSMQPPRPSAGAPSPQVMVHVAGKVRDPGVFTLPGGARVADAVKAAGGARGGSATGTLNLARRLVDGEQILVGVAAPPGAVMSSSSSSSSSASPLAPDQLMDLNTATTDQLEQLPGVGEVLAGRIAEFRDTRGGFRSVDQLKEVTGIGPAKFADLKDKVRV